MKTVLLSPICTFLASAKIGRGKQNRVYLQNFCNFVRYSNCQDWLSGKKTAVKKGFLCQKVNFATKKLSISVDFFVEMLYNNGVLVKMMLYT